MLSSFTYIKHQGIFIIIDFISKRVPLSTLGLSLMSLFSISVKWKLISPEGCLSKG